jgi:hypothetical protein
VIASTSRFDPRWQQAQQNYAERPQVLTFSTDVRESLERLDALGRVLDSAITIPGTNVTMGLDAALGLIPVVGDAITTALGSYIIWEARRLGVSNFTLARMAGNTALDATLGSIPIVGDVFDVAFRSNRKNIALLKRHLEKHGVRDGRTIDVTYTRT